MTFKPFIVIGLFTLFLVLGLFSRPVTAACIFAAGDDFSADQVSLLEEARTRISTKFGSIDSKPIVYFFDASTSYWTKHLNKYGSTSFLGYRTCVAIGPEGQNVDVVAHELMHAEIVSQTGLSARVKKLPVWFEEGLAMQVDYRQRYNSDSSEDYSFVTQLYTSEQFFVQDGKSLTKNYSAAKIVVKEWLSNMNEADLYNRLSRLKKGGSFECLWQMAPCDL